MHDDDDVVAIGAEWTHGPCPVSRSSHPQQAGTGCAHPIAEAVPASDGMTTFIAAMLFASTFLGPALNRTVTGRGG